MLSKRAKDVHRCLKHIDSFSKQQASVIDWDSDMLSWITLSLKPEGGPYRGGRFVFEISFGKHYPMVPPVVSCLTPMYHPNIDSTFQDCNVCLSLLDEWQETFGLEDLIQGLLFLLYHPNLDDPLSPLFEGQLEYDTFVRNVRRSLQGKEVMGFYTEKMIDCDYDDGDEDDDHTGEGLQINDTIEENVEASGSGSRDNIVEDIVQGVLHKVVADEPQNTDTVVNAVDNDNVDCASPAVNKTFSDDVGALGDESDWETDEKSGDSTMEGMLQSAGTNQVSGDGACSGTKSGPDYQFLILPPRSRQQQQERRHSGEERALINSLVHETLRHARIESAEEDRHGRVFASLNRRSSVNIDAAFSLGPAASVRAENRACFIVKHDIQNERTQSLLMKLRNLLENILPVCERSLQSTPPMLLLTPGALGSAMAVELSRLCSYPAAAPTSQSSIPIPDILKQVESLLENIAENGEPDDDIASDSDSYITDDSFDGDEEET